MHYFYVADDHSLPLPRQLPSADIMYHLIYSSSSVVLRHDDLLLLLIENEVKINERSRQEIILDSFLLTTTRCVFDSIRNRHIK